MERSISDELKSTNRDWFLISLSDTFAFGGALIVAGVVLWLCGAFG